MNKGKEGRKDKKEKWWKNCPGTKENTYYQAHSVYSLIFVSCNIKLYFGL